MNGFGIRWVDAAGTVVEGVTSGVVRIDLGNTVGGETTNVLYFDPDGIVWRLHPVTLQVTAGAFFGGGVFFPSTDCSGTPYYEVDQIPRLATQMTDGVFRARLDNPGPMVEFGSGAFAQYSVSLDGQCFVRGSPRLVATEADVIAVSVPTVSAVAPLHPELR